MAVIDKKTGIITSDKGYVLKFNSNYILVTTDDGYEFDLGYERVDKGQKLIVYDDTSMTNNNVQKEYVTHTFETLKSLGFNVELM